MQFSLAVRDILFVALVAGGLIQTAGAQNQTEPAREHAMRAAEALKSNQPLKAIPEFQALVDLDPANVDAQANLGVLLYFQQQFEPAAEHLRHAVTIQPNLSKIRGLLGLSELQLGAREQAIEDLRIALPQLEDAAFRKQVGLKLVELETSSQHLSDAAQVAQALRAKAPEDPEILYACYRTATDLAGDSLLSLSIAAPSSGQMQQAIGHELLRVRDIKGAIASFRRAVAADANLPGIHFELAEALRASPDTTDRSQAELEYRLALKSNPQDSQTQTRLADLLSDRNDWKDAEVLYHDALKLNPASAEAEIGLAHVDSETGLDVEAVALLERAIVDDPTSMLAHFRLSSLYRKLHRPEDAARELQIYQKLKQTKEKLRTVYSTMKLQAPGTNTASEATSEASH